MSANSRARAVRTKRYRVPTVIVAVVDGDNFADRSPSAACATTPRPVRAGGATQGHGGRMLASRRGGRGRCTPSSRGNGGALPSFGATPRPRSQRRRVSIEGARRLGAGAPAAGRDPRDQDGLRPTPRGRSRRPAPGRLRAPPSSSSAPWPRPGCTLDKNADKWRLQVDAPRRGLTRWPSLAQANLGLPQPPPAAVAAERHPAALRGGPAVAYFLDPVVTRLQRAGPVRTWATTDVHPRRSARDRRRDGDRAAAVHRGAALIGKAPQYFVTGGPARAADDRPCARSSACRRSACRSSGRGDAMGRTGACPAGQPGGRVAQRGVAFINLLGLLFITPVVTFYLLRTAQAAAAIAARPPDTRHDLHPRVPVQCRHRRLCTRPGAGLHRADP